MRIISITIIILTSSLLACGGGGSTTSTATASLQCDLAIKYVPPAGKEAQSYPGAAGTGTPPTTAILLHGKTGSQGSSTVQGLKTNLNTLGYDVVLPQMTWATRNWNGTLCDSISYLNDLIQTEKKAGKKVILLGHSLGGPGVLAYASLANTTKPDAVIPVAPGHFIHRSSKLAAGHAASITKAKNMIAKGQSKQIAVFQTLNGGVTQNINCTPVVYLSMHDVNQYPNITVSTAAVTIPLLWLAGNGDNLTAISNKFGLKSYIPNSASNSYKEITGTHIGIMADEVNTATVIDAWYRKLK